MKTVYLRRTSGNCFTSFVGECDKQSEIASTDFHWPSQLTSSSAPSANLNGNTYIYIFYIFQMMSDRMAQILMLDESFLRGWDAVLQTVFRPQVHHVIMWKHGLATRKVGFKVCVFPLPLSEPEEAPTGVHTTVMNSTVRVNWNEAQNVRGQLLGYKVPLPPDSRAQKSCLVCYLVETPDTKHFPDPRLDLECFPFTFVNPETKNLVR